MEQVGRVETGALGDTPPFFEQQENEFVSEDFSTSFHNSTETRSVFVDPCSDAVSVHVCINYPQLAIICVACFTVLLMIFVRVVFCCFNRRRRKRKAIPNILAMEADGPIRHTRLNSISVIGHHPPPRYSQIFDQDGISVFEEAPPDYETAQPDLLKSLPQNLSRTSSLASKGQQSEPDSETGQSTKPIVSLSVSELLRNSEQEVHC